MRQRELRQVRQHRQRERDGLLATAANAEPGQTLRHATINGYITDGCRCDSCRKAMRDWQRNRRSALRLKTRHLSAEAQVHAAQNRERELAAAKNEASPELAELIKEQEKDSYFVIHQRPWLLSLDTVWGDSDSGEDHYERGGLPVLVARQHGYFEWDPPWLSPLIERLDRELALRRAA